MTENPPKTTVLSGMFGRYLRRVATIGVLMGAIQLPATARDIVIPEPVPPPAAVRGAFDLSPFYRQWIDVEGMPVVASARVDPYAVKEAAWLIRKMIGHRQDLLRALAANGVRFAVMARNELTTQIPEHSDLIPGFYWDRRARGLGPTEIRPATSCGEENLLNYQGDPYATENILIHEFSHAIHLMGLNTVDSSFESRLAKAYDEARRKGLWSDTYAITNKEEYWAEGVQSWFDTNREHDSEHNHVNTRVELNRYDPALATLLVEIFGGTEWRYTPATERTNLLHLQGFNPVHSPIFEWPAELMDLPKLNRELRSRNSDGGGKWTDLKRHDRGSIAGLRSRDSSHEAAVIFVNGTGSSIAYVWIDNKGEEHYYGSVDPGEFVTQSTYRGHLWLVKDTDGRNMAAFRASGQTGRALVTSEDGTERGKRIGNGGDGQLELKQLDPSLPANATLKSSGGRVETAIVFVNRTSSEILYYWIDFEGKETYYGSVAPGAEVTQHTFDGHIWVAKDANGTSLAVFRASETPGRALITTKP